MTVSLVDLCACACACVCMFVLSDAGVDVVI